ncbi:MAG TPA: flagellar motor switch protein FliM [Armatimonadetes bacterium]|nr:flagellar motor switch protein FliM [Armatimonadota bacterium]
MSDILTQDEITALLSAFNRAEGTDLDPESGATYEIKIYDFKRPHKFSKDQVRTLEMIHERYARLLSTTLSTYLRAQTQVTLTGVDQLSYDEFIRSVPNPTVLNIFSFASEEGNAILEINPGIAYTVIDRMLGGKGAPPDRPRELTEIERALMTRIAGLALRDLGEAWSSLVDVTPTLHSISTSMLFSQIALPGDMVMLVTFEVELCGVTSMMSVCVPVIALEPIMSRLSAEQWFSAAHKGTTEDTTRAIGAQLDGARLTCRVILGTAVVLMGDLTTLEVGDVIRLDTRPGQELPLYIEDAEKFYGAPGVAGNRYALQITRGVQDDQSDLDLMGYEEPLV